MRLLLPVLMTLTACAVDRESWPDKYAKALCDFEKSCAAAQFYYLYDDTRDCLDEQEDYWKSYGEQAFETCTFDAGKAEECLDTLKSSCKDIGNDLNDFDPACDAVWDCAYAYGK